MLSERGRVGRGSIFDAKQLPERKSHGTANTMKAFVVCLCLLPLAACSSMGRPYVYSDADCDELVDARARLDCYEAADQRERDWREEQREKEERGQ